MTERHTTFRYTLEPTPAQVANFWRYAGASRFAFNQCIGFVKTALEAAKAVAQTDVKAAKRKKSQKAKTKVPWSGFDLINAFNTWKRTAAAGVNDAGDVGLPWRTEVCQQVFEEAGVHPVALPRG